MKKLLAMSSVLMVLAVGGCEDLEMLLGPSEEEETEVETGSYNYSFTCPAGGTYSVPIPNRLSASCRSEWEFYARTYGCNDADRFAEANRRKAACP